MVHPRIAMIRVENLDPILRQRNGPIGHVTGEYGEAVRKARLGERRGKWKILSGIEGMEYETRDMVSGLGGDYLMKDRFTLTKEDVFGKKEAK